MRRTAAIVAFLLPLVVFIRTLARAVTFVDICSLTCRSAR
jgi:hypothetical protein